MIIAVAGRRVDAPNSLPERFPAASVESIKQRLSQFMESHHVDHLVCSAACGTDLLALQAAKDLSIPSTVVLPFETSRFRSSSVVDRPGEWGATYDNLMKELEESSRLIVLNYDADDPEVYTKANLEILDQAEKLVADRRIPTQDAKGTSDDITALIVWEGKPKDSDDTTYHFMLEAQKRNIQTKEIRISP